MKTDIDWSYAPEWAGAIVACGKLSYWVTSWGCISPRQMVGSGDMDEGGLVDTREGNEHRWVLIETRPATAWTGEGLPPAGTVCEAWHNGCAQGVVQVRYSGGCMVLWNVKLKHEQCSASENYTFKPIRTPEQIAAEEREKSIDDLVGIIGGIWFSERECAAHIYEAGYRKVEGGAQ